MEKIPALIISIFLVGMLAIPINAGFLKIEKTTEYEFDNKEITLLASHHKVLGEQGTATWCPYCPSMSYWLERVNGDFQYVALVADKNGYANSRCSELGLTGYPTTFFDGGYRSVIGGQSSVTNLQNAYSQCQARTVADIDITISAIFDEDEEKLDVNVFIDNTGTVTYNGHLRVYITEKTSRWLDYNGIPYKFALLGYAFNKPIIIGPGDTWSDTKEDWTYQGITLDNLRVVAAVFDASTGYTDEVATADPTTGGSGGGDYRPLPVVSVNYPFENQLVNGTITISGSAHHPISDGLLKWVMVKIGDNDWEEAEGIVSWNYEWDTTNMEDGQCTIQAVTSDGSSQSGVVYVPVIINNHGNLPPDIPEKPTGPENGEAGYFYTYSTSAEDLNFDDLRYGWDWDGDDVVDEWTDYILEGEPIETQHSWDSSGTYNVKVKAEDSSGDQSEFSDELVVKITGTNDPPSAPDISGPSSAKAGKKVEYTFVANDPEGSDIYLYIEWFEGCPGVEWIGPYESGEEVKISNTWTDEGTYVISARAKDLNGLEGETGTLTVTMPKNKIINIPLFLQKFFQRFPFFEKILKQILI